MFKLVKITNIIGKKTLHSLKLSFELGFYYEDSFTHNNDAQNYLKRLIKHMHSTSK